MTVSLDLKKEFLLEFQSKLIQSRRLLQSGNHRWAYQLLTNLYLEIEKKDWIDAQKRHQLIMVTTNTWWMYLNSLKLGIQKGKKIDVIKYIDAYKRFFTFLSKLDDFYLFNTFCTNLIKSFIEMEDLSAKGITKFINSFSLKVDEKGDNLKILELQVLLFFLRKTIIHSDFFKKSMVTLRNIIFKLEPGKRALFLYVIIENVNIKYQLMEDSTEFIKFIYKVIVTRLPDYLKNEFGSLSRISINERNFKGILNELEDLIHYLNDIGEQAWIIVIIRNAFSKINEFQSFEDAISYIRNFIGFSIDRNRFEIAFEIYDFLEDLFMYKTDLMYDNNLIEMWVEACKNFVDMKERKYLLQSLEKLNNHLRLPQTNAQIFHYFYTCNYIWKFKSMFFSLEQSDFWRMIFYRALFEEKDYNLAQKILPLLDNNLQSVIADLNDIVNEVESLKNQIYSFDEDLSLDLKMFPPDFVVLQLLLRIDSDGTISYRIKFTNGEFEEGIIRNEFWNDSQILEIFNDLFSEKSQKDYNFDIIECGKLLYIFLPKIIRMFLSQLKVPNLDVIPQIYFILDNLTIPFELLYDDNFCMLKYASGYKIGNPSLGGISFEISSETSSEYTQLNKKYNALVIESINSKVPLKWNEEKSRKDILFPFLAGSNELQHITDFFYNRNEIGEITVLSDLNATRESVLTHISKGSYHILHFVGNVFYSNWSPFDSFFLTNDNQILKFSEISNSINNCTSEIKPFLFFNVQIYDLNRRRFNDGLNSFGEIVEKFNYNKITGIITKIYPIFNDETKFITANFYINLFNNNNQGNSLLKSRMQLLEKKKVGIIEDIAKELDAENVIKKIGIESIVPINSLILFGKPWKKLIF
jgi:hypothetical protein